MVYISKGRFLKAIYAVWISFVSVFLLIILYFVALNYNFLYLFGEIPGLEALENPRNELASEVYTADNILMGKYYRENRTPVKYEELSPYLVNALIATEDIRFEEHSGIDLKAIFRAVLTLGSEGGGSTITQQLAKNLYKTRESRGLLHDVPLVGTFVIKSKEWLTSVKIERSYTKQEIIEMYLNTVEFGSNAFGINTAARTFFDKDPSQLNAPESAVLIGLLKAPTYFSPISNYENSLRRRNVVLFQMKKYGYITDVQYNLYKREVIELRYGVEDHVSGIAPYFREEVKKFLLQWAKDRNRDLYKDGLRIYTTIDSKMQLYAEDAVRQHMIKFQKLFYDHWRGRNPWVDVWNKEIPNFIENEAKKTPRYKELVAQYGTNEKKINAVMNKPIKMRIFSWQGEKDTLMSPMDSIRYYKHFLHTGFMSMEPKTGHVKAWVGGINFKYFQYDHVHQGMRQPGSTFKPILYAAALDNGYTPCYQLRDEPVRFSAGGGRAWIPRNANLSYSGAMMTLRQGIGTSTNSIAAGLMKRIGPKIVVEYARDLGITSPMEETATLCLGTSDVSVYELLGAYSAFANRGRHTVPVYVTRIEDRHGNLIEEFVPKVTQAISEELAYQMLYILRASLEPGGTSTALHGYGHGENNVGWHNEIAAKTGTTQNYSDAWFMGVTRELSAGIWVGGDNRAIRFTTIVLGQGAVMALPPWGLFFEKIYADPELRKKYTKGAFERPEELTIELDCAKMQMEKQKLLEQ